ncbi:TetR/AcrR family transcriptional regulator [Streptomyces sp. NPDC088812]|uniref:TetR/AcrR family transcriptional regulator n=1 Tax=Streptomyces sp. NPDC088812 TaxID=3365905 RepID=UPI0037FA1A91
MTRESVRAPQQDRSRDKLERIYAAAVTLLIEGGWDAITVGEVERRSKVSRSTFYLRFPNRDALIDYTRQRLLQEVAEAEAGTFEQARSAHPATLDAAVRAAVDALAAVCRTYGPVMLRMDNPQEPGMTDKAMNTLSTRFRSVIEPVLPTEATRERVEFAIELVFASLVGKMRPQQPFTAHARRTWDTYLDQLSRATVRYLTG